MQASPQAGMFKMQRMGTSTFASKKIIMSRRATMLDSRLNQLKTRNMNVGKDKEEQDAPDIPKTLL